MKSCKTCDHFKVCFLRQKQAPALTPCEEWNGWIESDEVPDRGTDIVLIKQGETVSLLYVGLSKNEWGKLSDDITGWRKVPE